MNDYFNFGSQIARRQPHPKLNIRQPWSNKSKWKTTTICNGWPSVIERKTQPVFGTPYRLYSQTAVKPGHPGQNLDSDQERTKPNSQELPYGKLANGYARVGQVHPHVKTMAATCVPALCFFRRKNPAVLSGRPSAGPACSLKESRSSAARIAESGRWRLSRTTHSTADPPSRSRENGNLLRRKPACLSGNRPVSRNSQTRPASPR